MKKLTWINLQSTNLSRTAYDNVNSFLFIEFKNGITYKYYNVPKTIYTGLINSPSKGKYHDTYIKINYQYEQI